MAIYTSLSDPIFELMAGFPVFRVVVGAAMLLTAAGFVIVVVPALRRHRGLVTAWVLIVSTSSLAGMVYLLWGLTQFT